MFQRFRSPRQQLATELGALMDGPQTGRAPSAVRSLAPLRLLKIDRTNSDGQKKRPAHKKKREMNTSTSNMEDRKAYRKKNNTRTTNSSQTFKTKKRKKKQFK